MAWVGFAVGLCLFALTWSSVVKTLLVPGNTRSLIARVAARGVLTGFWLGASRIAGMERRERVLAAGPPMFLVVLLGCWIACLYVAYALILLPFAGRTPGGQSTELAQRSGYPASPTTCASYNRFGQARGLNLVAADLDVTRPPHHYAHGATNHRSHLRR